MDHVKNLRSFARLYAAESRAELEAAADALESISLKLGEHEKLVSAQQEKLDELHERIESAEQLFSVCEQQRDEALLRLDAIKSLCIEYLNTWPYDARRFGLEVSQIADGVVERQCAGCDDERRNELRSIGRPHTCEQHREVESPAPICDSLAPWPDEIHCTLRAGHDGDHSDGKAFWRAAPNAAV